MFLGVSCCCVPKVYPNTTMPTLSDRKIRNAKPAEKDLWLNDGAGLYCRVRPNGTKTFVLRRKRSGNTTKVTLGSFSDMTIAEARSAAGKLSNVIETRKLTFGDTLDEWYTRRIEPRYRVTKNICTYVRLAKEEFGALPLRRLTTAALVRWLQRYAEKKPVAANRCCSTIKMALGYAVECGYLETNPLQAVTVRVIGGEEKSSDRTLTDAEIVALWKAENKLLRFLLLTGLRISEGQQGRKDGSKYRMDRTKNGDPHWVHLPALAEAQVEPFNTSPTAVQAWLRRWCEREEVSPFTPHDLRRTFATRLAGLGIAPHIIEKCLNHRMQGVMEIYNRHDYEPERVAAAEQWATELQKILTSTNAA